MNDLVAGAEGAFGEHAAVAAALVFAAGVLSSLGPCTAPRLIALTGLIARGPRVAATTFAFVGGIAIAYAMLAIAASALAGLRAWSPLLDAAFAAALIAGGCFALRLPRTHVHDERRVPGSLGGVMFAGVAFGCTVSPCCTPLVAAIGAFAAASHRTELVALYVVAFACGHAAPLIALGLAGAAARGRIVRIAGSPGVATVSGGVLFALALYYAALVV